MGYIFMKYRIKRQNTGTLPTPNNFHMYLDPFLTFANEQYNIPQNKKN